MYQGEHAPLYAWVVEFTHTATLAHGDITDIDVVVDGELLASATRKAKKEAEQEAARLALEKVGLR